MSSGKEVEQQTFDGASTQKWKFVYYGGGNIYTIRSAQNNSYYLGVENNSTDDDANIVLRTGTITSGMKWRITQGNEGWKICAFSDTSMVLTTNSSNKTPGEKLILGDWVDNDSYRDEWEIEPCLFMFYGVTNIGHNHISCINAIANSLHDSNWARSTVRSGAISASTCKNDLLSTNVFTSRSHGHLITYTNSDNVAATGILLNDTNVKEDYVGFYSHSWNGMSSYSISISSGDDYDGLEVALFIGCETAKGGNEDRNLPSSIVSRGAIAAIGFTESIDCEEANDWTINFYNKMLEGATLFDAVAHASSLASESSGLRSAVICGDSSIRFLQN